MLHLNRYDDFELYSLFERLHVDEDLKGLVRNIHSDVSDEFRTLMRFSENPPHNQITFSDKSGYLKFGNDNHIKIGRFMNQFFKYCRKHNLTNTKFSDVDIEKFVDALNKEIDLYKGVGIDDVVVVKGKDIEKVYCYITEKNVIDYDGELGSSCMNKGREGYIRMRKPYFDIYVKNDNVSMAVIWEGEAFKSKLKARALIWEGARVRSRDTYYEMSPIPGKSRFFYDEVHTIMDRVYSGDYLSGRKLISWARSKNYPYFGVGGNYIINGQSKNYYIDMKLKNYKFTHYPYMDTFKYSDDEGNFRNHDDEGIADYYYQSTRGKRGVYGKKNIIQKFKGFGQTIKRGMADFGATIDDFLKR